MLSLRTPSASRSVAYTQHSDCFAYGQRNVTRLVPLDSPHHAESTDTERVPIPYGQRNVTRLVPLDSPHHAESTDTERVLIPYGQRNVTRLVLLDSPHHAESTDTERVLIRGLYAAQRLLSSVHFLPIDYVWATERDALAYGQRNVTRLVPLDSPHHAESTDTERVLIPYGQRNVTRLVLLDSPHHAESTDTERVLIRGLYAAQRLLSSVHFLPID
ncbi:hypothetical protein niasHT_032590 [Heterodera trifolii]|uniref:Uncharacterized protein n=1 Tax=Heterodera trifolii TaxID=157864 RepID=A0ABD2ISW0_9BILA